MFEQKRQLSYYEERQDNEDECFTRPKKFRTEEPPSKVLHLRGFPPDINEKEIAYLGVPFGIIRNLLVTKNGQALLEFQLQECATKMLDYYTTYNPPVIRGQHSIGIQYSKYPELTMSAKSDSVENIVAANKISLSLTSSDSNRTVLRVQIDQAPPVALGYMPFYQTFNRFGRITRIVTFKAGSIPQAFVEFLEPASVDVSKLQLDGSPFVAGGICRTNYSRQQTLDVHQENQFCRDFIKNPMSLEESHYPTNMIDLKPNSNLPNTRNLASMDAAALCSFANEVIQAMVFVASGQRGHDLQVMQNQITTMRQLIPIVQTSPASNGNQFNGSQTNWMDQTRKHSQSNSSPVLLVSQLNSECITPDILFTLFGVYGDVQRVKILFNKKDSALIQFTDGHQANLAMQFLNGVPLFGNNIRVSHSKFSTINKSQFSVNDSTTSDSDTTELTRDYAGSKFHRFKNANSRNFLNICAPNCVLHISSLPDGVTKSDITFAFSEHVDHTIVDIKLLPNDKRMALIEFENLNCAIEALIVMDTFQLKPNNCIRVTFSKYQIKNDSR